MNYAGKNIAVLGLGRSGKAAARLLAREGALVTLLDSGNSELILREARLLATEFKVLTGDAAAASADNFDQVILSPGIDRAAQIVRQFTGRGISLIGELELAAQFCQAPIIAITGTNGKTTVTELVATMLQMACVPTVACGNIGLPFSDIAGRIDLEAITLEVSSFQLETIGTFHPKIAVWLNLTPDHLDRYADFEEYRQAKLRVFENQTTDDFAVVNRRDDLPAVKARKLTFSAYVADADLNLRNGVIWFREQSISPISDFRLEGLHNVENIMAALGVAAAMKIPFSTILSALQQYHPAPHRCEKIAIIDGVEFINDSKATNPDALARALEAQPRKVILIAGGKDKGFAFDNLQTLIASKVKKAFLIGEMADEMARTWEAATECEIVATLADAVHAAQALAVAGDAVLFSPGTSSFDMFRDYADRGNQFRLLTNALFARKTAPLPS